MKHDIGVVDAIALEVDTKTPEEVKCYYEVFMHRFRELKESDQIILKFQKKDFEERNLETIRDFDAARAD
jgi:hypothetical protein